MTSYALKKLDDPYELLCQSQVEGNDLYLVRISPLKDLALLRYDGMDNETFLSLFR